MKNRLVRLALIFILTFVYCGFNNIEAKDIKIKVTLSGDKSEAYFDSMIGAFETEVTDWGASQWKFATIDSNGNLNEKGAHKVYTNEKTKAYSRPFNGNILDDYKKKQDEVVRSYSFVIHNVPLSSYNESSNGQYIYTTSYTQPNSKKATVSRKTNTSDEKILEFTRLSSYYTIAKFGDYHINVQHNLIPNQYLKKLNEEMQKNLKNITEEGECYKFYVSEPLAWHIPKTSFTEDNFLYRANKNIWELNGNNLENVQRNVGLLRASDVIGNHKGWSDLPAAYMLSGRGDDGSTSLASYLNYYDNILLLPKNIVNTNSKVYVRHVLVDKDDKKIKDLDGNDAEILAENGKEKVLNNTPGKLTDSQKNQGFSEYYELNSNQSLKVSRSLTLVENGKYYDIKSVSSSTATDFNTAFKKHQGAKEDKGKNIIEVNADNNSKVTVITFKYQKNDNPKNDPDPYGNVKTLKSSDNTDRCSYSYTPTTSEYADVSVTPYLKTDKISSIKNLKYTYKKVGDQVGYKLSEFIVNKLESGNIDNSDTDKEGIGEVFSNDKNNKKALLEKNKNGNSFYLTKNIDAKSILYILDLKNDNNFRMDLPDLDNLRNQLKSPDNRTVVNNWITNSNSFKVKENVYNGIRKPKLAATYCEYDVIHGQGSKTTQTFETKNDVYIVAYNPIKIGDVKVESKNIVDHTTSNENSTSVIQKNADFTLSIDSSKNTTGFYSDDKYNNMLKYYYIKFDFNVKINQVKLDDGTEILDSDIKYYSPTLIEEKFGSEDEIPKDTIIQIPYKYINKDNKKNIIEINAKAGSNVNSEEEYIAQGATQITLIGSSTNVPNDKLVKEIFDGTKSFYSESDNLSFKIGDFNKYLDDNFCPEKQKKNTFYKDFEAQKDIYSPQKMYYDAYYFVKSNTEIKTVGRIYDFEITDCSDIDYKSVFRSTKNGNVNKHTGNIYFSGMKEFDIFSEKLNNLELRDDNILNISGTSAKKILPLGPYKNTNTSYVKAPKMGYRISFDLKTSGYYNYTTDAKSSKRVIKIIPSYYYISKDGQTYNSKINLYYKNSDGKYVKFDGSNYTIYFKPKDGYRTYSNSQVTPNLSVMSDQLEALDISNKEGFELNYKMMATNNNNFIQSWYGEFKLPNSTIAIIGSDISHPLTDGYIGVRFYIVCTDMDKDDKTVQEISYNTNNKNADPNINTSQWDYEGYLGFSNPGSAAGDIALQLEKGTWTVNDNNSEESKAKYKDIKGTVVLFDLDNRAANDFD